MTAHLAFLRAVNVGGRGRVPMAKLCAVVRGLGFPEVRSFLQTGNLVLGADPRATSELERLLERAVERELGLRTDVLVRSGVELGSALKSNPFPRLAPQDPAHLLLFLLKAAPTPEGLRRLTSSFEGPEEVRLGARHLYATYPSGIAGSELTLDRIERAFGTRGTARNWNTMTKVHALASAPPRRP